MKTIYLITGLLIFITSCNNSSKKVEAEITRPEELDDIFLTKIEDIDSLWRNSNFDSAVAVILNGDHRIYSNVRSIDTVYAITSRRKLSHPQLTLITESLSGKKQGDYNPADCFVPFHGIFFYKNGEITGRVAICFSCGEYKTLPRISGIINFEKTKQVFLDLGLPAYNWDDNIETAEAKVKYKDFYPKVKIN